MVLRLHPELRLDSWNVGSFRLTETATESDPEQKASWQRLTLVGGGLAPEGKQPLRPSARLQVHGVEFRARQLAWWQPGPLRSTLTLQVQYEVSAGKLYELPIQLPAGWDIDRVETSPSSLMGAWRLRRDKGVLVVELQKPLSGESAPSSGAASRKRTGLLTVGLVAPGIKLAMSASRKQLAFPEAIPLGARFREGALALSLDPAFQAAELRTPLRASQPQAEAPWGNQLPGHYFPYREQPLEGTLVVQPCPVQLRASSTTDILLQPGDTPPQGVGVPPLGGLPRREDRLKTELQLSSVETELEIEVESGTTDSVEVRTSADVQSWNWRSASPTINLTRAERLLERERLALVGLLGVLVPAGPSTLLGPGLRAGLCAAVESPGPCWRLTFQRSLRPQERVLLQASSTFGPSGESAAGVSPHSVIYRVPLFRVSQARRLEGQVRLRLARPRKTSVATAGLQEIPVPPGPMVQGRPIWRAFRLCPGPAQLELVCSGSREDKGGGRARPGHPVAGSAGQQARPGRHHRAPLSVLPDRLDRCSLTDPTAGRRPATGSECRWPLAGTASSRGSRRDPAAIADPSDLGRERQQPPGDELAVVRDRVSDRGRSLVALDPAGRIDPWTADGANQPAAQLAFAGRHPGNRPNGRERSTGRERTRRACAALPG